MSNINYTFKKLIQNYLQILENEPCCYFNSGLYDLNTGVRHMIFENCQHNNKGLEITKEKIIDLVKFYPSNDYIKIYNEYKSGVNQGEIYFRNDLSNTITKNFNTALIEHHFILPYYYKMMELNLIQENKVKDFARRDVIMLLSQHKREVIWFRNDLEKLILKSTTQPTPTKKITFEHKLNDTQLENLLQLINDIKLFNIELDKSTLINLLNCNLENALNTNTTYFVHLFDELSTKKLITKKFHNIIEVSKLFIGSRGKYIKSSNVSSTIAKISNKDIIISKITNSITEISKMN